MIWYIYLLQFGFLPTAEVGKIVQKWKRDSYTQKEKQHTKQHKNKEYTK